MIMSSCYCDHVLNDSNTLYEIFQRVHAIKNSLLLKWVLVVPYRHQLLGANKNSQYKWIFRDWIHLKHNPHWSVARLWLNEESLSWTRPTPPPPSLLPLPYNPHKSTGDKSKTAQSTNSPDKGGKLTQKCQLSKRLRLKSRFVLRTF